MLVPQVQSAVDIDQPLFQPFPAEVVFHNYEPFKKYSALLHLRNNDKVGIALQSANTAASGPICAHGDLSKQWVHTLQQQHCTNSCTQADAATFLHTSRHVSSA